MSTTKISYFAPIEAARIASLTSDSITKKEYDKIISEIEKRFSYVFLTSMEIMERKVNWYDYC